MVGFSAQAFHERFPASGMVQKAVNEDERILCPFSPFEIVDLQSPHIDGVVSRALHSAQLFLKGISTKSFLSSDQAKAKIRLTIRPYMEITIWMLSGKVGSPKGVAKALSSSEK